MRKVVDGTATSGHEDEAFVRAFDTPTIDRRVDNPVGRAIASIHQDVVLVSGERGFERGADLVDALRHIDGVRWAKLALQRIYSARQGTIFARVGVEDDRDRHSISFGAT